MLAVDAHRFCVRWCGVEPSYLKYRGASMGSLESIVGNGLLGSHAYRRGENKGTLGLGVLGHDAPAVVPLPRSVIWSRSRFQTERSCH